MIERHSSGGVVVQLNDVGSPGELRRRVTNGECDSVLGANIEAPREFFVLNIRWPGGQACRLCIASAGIGVSPAWLFRDDTVFVGYNDEVAISRSDRPVVVSALMSLFRTFVACEQCNHCCVVCETALVALSDEGAEVWRIDTDLITDLAVSGSKARLGFDSVESMTIDLTTGTRQP
jgi:hypothetical protein